MYCLACRQSLQYSAYKVRLHLGTIKHGKNADYYTQSKDAAAYPDKQVLEGRLISLVRPDEPHIWWIAVGKGL